MDFTQQLIQQLINGVSLGSVYALIALGYTMVYAPRPAHLHPHHRHRRFLSLGVRQHVLRVANAPDVSRGV